MSDNIDKDCGYIDRSIWRKSRTRVECLFLMIYCTTESKRPKLVLILSEHNLTSVSLSVCLAGDQTHGFVIQ